MVAPALDVIIRMHDPARLDELDRAVFSAALQDHRPTTLHVVCQRFTPAHLAAAETRLDPIRAITPDVSIHLHNRPDPEPRDARAALLNQGLGIAQGRYVAFLDYDDLIYPEAYRLLIAELQASGAAIAFGGILNAEVTREGLVPMTLRKRRVFEGEGLSRLLRNNFCPLHSFVLDRTRIGPEELHVDETLTFLEDYDLLLRLCAGYTSSFRLKDKIVGEYLFKDDASNTNPLAHPPTAAAWNAALAEIERRKSHLVLGPEVQATLGVGRPGLTVAAYLARQGEPP